MNNTDFTKLLRKTVSVGNKFRALLREAEAEYERRYGVNPSDTDDDMWIDAITGSSEDANPRNVSWKTVDGGAVEYAKLEPYTDG